LTALELGSNVQQSFLKVFLGLDGVLAKLVGVTGIRGQYIAGKGCSKNEQEDRVGFDGSGVFGVVVRRTGDVRARDRKFFGNGYG
jgi:hypothetical protein